MHDTKIINVLTPHSTYTKRYNPFLFLRYKKRDRVKDPESPFRII